MGMGQLKIRKVVYSRTLYGHGTVKDKKGLVYSRGQSENALTCCQPVQDGWPKASHAFAKGGC